MSKRLDIVPPQLREIDLAINEMHAGDASRYHDLQRSYLASPRAFTYLRAEYWRWRRGQRVEEGQPGILVLPMITNG
jgi:hypothetical protein